ncbi:MAG: helicase-related protein, partial [Acetobacteraceae bacterium]
MQVTAGIKVRARGLLWDVVAADPCGPEQRLHLRCAGGDLAGLEWDILHPLETVEVAHLDLRPDAAAPLAAWRLHHIAALLDQDPGPLGLVSARPGRLTVEPYQLVPLMRALTMPRARLLLADGVGLGKTVQAGLIAAELIARRRAHRILVVAPAGPLLAQWDQELRLRFGLRPSIIADAAALRAQRGAMALGGNPFDTVALCLTSPDFAKQDAVLTDLERTSWDLVIIDEAHHIAGSPHGTGEETRRRRLAEVLAERCDGLLLLTATPHDGDDARFASLIALLDPSLVDGQGRLLDRAYRRHVIRRLKAHLSNPETGRPLFRERRITPVAIDPADPALAPARDFHRALSAFVAPRLQRKARAAHPSDSLAFVSLLKRSVSTLAACIATLRVIADRYAGLDGDEPALRRERRRALRTLRQRLARYGVLSPSEEQAQAALEAEGMAAALHEAGTPAAAALRNLIHLGTAATAQDPKLDALVREVKLIRASTPTANILVYTEYADSQDAAVARLGVDPAIDGAVLAVSGRDPEAARARAADRFARQDGLILVSTDSLAEGLNLHRRCRHLIHLDLPYNPNRLEQRNGRIDRYGQTQDPDIRYLYLAATFEERLLLRLIAKYEKARSALTLMPDTLGVTANADACAAPLVRGFAEEQAMLFPPAPSPIRTLDRIAEEAEAEPWRDLLREIDRAYHGFEPTSVRHGWAASQGVNADSGGLAQGARVRDAAEIMTGAIDLAMFVRDAIRAGGGSTDGSTWHAPPGWGGDHDATIHVAPDPDTLHDAAGHDLTWFGRAHGLVRRSIEQARLLGHGDRPGEADARVAAIHRSDIREPTLLLTYAIELHTPRRLLWRRLAAARLTRHGEVQVMTDSRAWLALVLGTDADDTAWTAHFSSWAPQRLEPVRQSVAAAMAGMAAEVAE